MKDPVLAPSGITYERSTILEHLSRNGSTDPTTRERLSKRQLIENKTMKKHIEAFTQENPSACDFMMPDERFDDIDL